MGRDGAGKAAGGHNLGIFAQFFFYAVYHAVYHAGVAEYSAAFHAVHGVGADTFFWRFHCDVLQKSRKL